MSSDKTARELHDATEVIAQQKALSDALFLSIGEGAIATDIAGNISRVNRVALKLLGFKREELIGRWYPTAIVMTDEAGQALPAIERPIIKAFLAGEAICEQKHFRKKDGSLLPVAVNVSPIILDDKPMGAIEVFRDMTEELAVDRIKSEFISLASHQLRTPATAVKAYIGLLMDGFAEPLSEKQMEFAEMAYNSNERQLQIVNDLLLIANTESRTLKMKKVYIDLRSLIIDVAEEQLGTIRKRKQQLELDLPHGKIIHPVDPSFFKMVVDNLLSNASKYTPKGGTLSLCLMRLKREVVLSVSDTGVGIAAADMDKLFKKFTRIDNPLSAEAGGTGIGLYLLKQIVDLHDGEVAVESTRDLGTTFMVKLPAA